MNVDRFTMTHRSAQLALLLGLAFLPTACGSSGKARVYPIRGEVFFQGKPAGGAVVHLHPRDKEKRPPAFATVSEDGSFQLTTYSSNDGAAEGDYAVTVIWRNERQEDGETIYSPDKFQGRFSRSETSRLAATIKAGNNDLVRFDLR